MPRFLLAVPVLILAVAIHPDPPPDHRSPIVLAGERVIFDDNSRPQFSIQQVRMTAAATRDGLTKFAATAHGRTLLAWFAQNECSIVVTEEDDDAGAGKAPQPGLATLVAASDPTRPKTYALSLNPRIFELPAGISPLPHQPLSTSDVMAAAWAAELLHISFYARGISLPHHRREDFQSEWRTMAAELGFPGLPHDDSVEEERRALRRALILGYGRQ